MDWRGSCIVLKFKFVNDPQEFRENNGLSLL